MSGLNNDIQNWCNYTATPSAAEIERIVQIVGNAEFAQELLAFGIRPWSALDQQPQACPQGKLDQPFEVLNEHLSDDAVLVDIVTGFRFRYLPDKGGLVFDMLASSNYMDAMELLMLAAHRGEDFPFERITRPTYVHGPTPVIFGSEYILPLTFHVTTPHELQATLERLTDLFCVKCPRTTKLWLRGQRCEYPFKRSEELSMQIYGVRQHASLLPSAGRYAFENPEKMGFGISFSGPNHEWKKPFLIWLMRQNFHWFEHDPRALKVLSEVLADDDEEAFVKVLMAIQMGSFVPEVSKLAEGVSWPDEADDLRQWFFAHMKPHSFGITLQQYGYVTSLLDLTDDVNVAVYFSQAAMFERKIRKVDAKPGRLIYVFAERRTGDFFRHGDQLFWGDDDWVRRLPPRLAMQKAGFLMGSTCRTQNFYSNMIVARIFLDSESIQTPLRDEDLFPTPENDLLLATLLDSRPRLKDLY